MAAKKEADQRWDRAYGPKIVGIIKKAKADTRKWQLTGIPCAHAVSGMLSRRIEIDEFVDEYYKNERYLMAYNPVIQLMPGSELWPELGKHPLKPPVKKKQAGRLKKLRKRSQTEPPARVKMTRIGIQMTCRRCGEAGHNKRTCIAQA
ncbi:uncharacterized protein LOC111371957 [Olea europaea var. sylvestris]|uniref:uncharacterized protein LOC111371957 n=1 Tax=Olea europaea var. sylvestris TaxID=158386 RepID=UPI000C1D3D8F|nr:uncharacterized protein LOC111371957 [Olea europaea var. sylvestris]